MVHSRCLVLIGVNCLEESLEFGGKKLEPWFWDQVTSVAGVEGDWTGPPPASLALMSQELGGGWERPLAQWQWAGALREAQSRGRSIQGWVWEGWGP